LQSPEQRKRVVDLFHAQSTHTPKYLNWGYNFMDKALMGFNHGLFIITAPANQGKCQVEGTLVALADGSLKPIEDIQNDKVLSLDTNTLKIVASKATNTVYTGERLCYQLVTSLGHKIVATDNHPLYTLNGWKEIKDLSVADKIAVAGNLPFFGNNSITKEECIVLGLMIGDGYCNTTPSFTTADPSLIKTLTDCMIAIYGDVDVRVDEKSGGKASSYIFPLRLASRPTKEAIYTNVAKDTGLALYRVYTLLDNPDIYADTTDYTKALSVAKSYGYTQNIYTNKVSPMIDILTRHSVYGKTSGDKCIPSDIFTAPKEKIAAFISALYACDGSAYTMKDKSFGGITYTSKSEQLIRGLQQLLLRFNIATRIRHRNIKCGLVVCEAWQLDFSGRVNALRFAKEIGIISKEKQLAEFLDLPITVRSHNSIVSQVPKEVSTYICNLLGAQVLPDKISTIRSDVRKGSRAIHKERIQQLGEYMQDDYLCHLGSSDVVWDKIVSIEPVGIRKVYDIEVPETHNFIANNIIVHNSAMLLNIYTQLMARNDDVFVMDFTLDDSFEDRVSNSIAGRCKIPINWVKNHNHPDVTAAARNLIKKEYDLWINSHFKHKLDMRDETDFNNRCRFFSVMRQHILETRQLYPDKKLVICIDGFHNVAIDNPAYSDEYSKQQYLSAEMKTLSAETNAIIIATAHTPKKSMRRGLDQDAVKGGGGITYDAKVISTIYSDYKVNRENAQVFFQAALPHAPGGLATLPIIELDIVKNKTSSFTDILFYRFYPEYAFVEECDDKFQFHYKSLVLGADQKKP
jgi:replicative DNA helicase